MDFTSRRQDPFRPVSWTPLLPSEERADEGEGPGVRVEALVDATELKDPLPAPRTLCVWIVVRSREDFRIEIW